MLLCGGMKELYQYCQSLRFPNEKLNCCHNGKVSLLPLSDYILKELFIGSHSKLLNLEITLEIIIMHLHLPLLEPR